MRYPPRLSLLASAAFGVLSACGGSPPPATTPPVQCRDVPLTSTGMAGKAVQARVTGNVFAVNGAVNGVDGGYLIVDTGAPITLLDSASYPNAQVPSGSGTVNALETLGLTFEKAPVVGGDLALSLPDVPVGGLIGGNVLCHFPASFNYRDAQVTLGATQDPTAVLNASSVPFTLEGGGRGLLPDGKTLVTFYNTRVTVKALVEGKERVFIVDTGASLSLVTKELFDELTADGRGKLDGLAASTVMGNAQTRVTRVRSMSLGTAEVTGTPVADVSGQLLLALGVEVGHPVDGLLGGTFLREFFVTADYDNSQLRLARYATQAHVTDEFRRVGALLTLARAPSPARYAIGAVLPNTDAAAQGLKSGEALLKVNGTNLNDLEAEAADALLHGEVGSPRELTLETRTVTVKVDELLKLP